MNPKFVMAASISALMLMAASAVAQDSAVLNPVNCVSNLRPVRLSARVPAGTQSAKVFFKANGTGPEYYVMLRRGATGEMWGFLPAPVAGTRTLTYRLVSNRDGALFSSPAVTAPVTNSCSPERLTPEQKFASEAMVIGLTSAKQSAVPAGFSCSGVVSYVDAKGLLQRNQECRQAVAFAQIDEAPNANALLQADARLNAAIKSNGVSTTTQATPQTASAISAATIAHLTSSANLSIISEAYGNSLKHRRNVSRIDAPLP